MHRRSDYVTDKLKMEYKKNLSEKNSNDLYCFLSTALLDQILNLTVYPKQFITFMAQFMRVAWMLRVMSAVMVILFFEKQWYRQKKLPEFKKVF